MEFYSAPYTKRPIRLSEATRQFAFDSLNHRYGLLTKETPAVEMDGIEGFAEKTELEQYDLAIEKICREAPIRVCENELISGAATLGLAMRHYVPATINGKQFIGSISHLTVDFGKLLRIGWNGIKKEVEESRKNHSEQRDIEFLDSCLHCINCLEIWHKRYLNALKDAPEYQENYQTLLHVPFEPAKTFRQAVQSVWFSFAFMRLCGNWPGIGRIDEMLEPYLQNDLKNGAITLDEAREILSHLFIKGCEWITGSPCGSGDAQHYQNIVLGGINKDGKDVTGDVTYLVLDIIEETGISDFPTTVRLSKNSPEKLINRVAEVIRYGGGVVAVYNEDLVIDAMTRFGYDLSEARTFANDGCWEVQVPGKTYFTYSPFDSLRLLQEQVLDNYSGSKTYNSFEELFSAYSAVLKKHIENHANGIMHRIHPGTTDWKVQGPCTVVSLLEDGCIEKARNYLEGGPRYNVISPHIGGLPDLANALYAIKKLVFDEKKVSFVELMSILKNNWEDNDFLRTYTRSHYRYFGNDNDEVDNIARDVLCVLAESCKKASEGAPIKIPSGVSTFGRQIEWSSQRLATPHGFEAGKVLSGNLSPTPGTDFEGATAIIKSYCKCDLVHQTTGAALDISILPSSVKGETGLLAIVGLLKSFVALGGFFMQLDVTDVEVLRLAQEHPEDYQTLSVRVSGWNARFVTMSKSWQDMVIEKNSK